MQNTSINYNDWTVDQLKSLNINTLSKVEKLKFKNSRPTPDNAITKIVV